MNLISTPWTRLLPRMPSWGSKGHIKLDVPQKEALLLHQAVLAPGTASLLSLCAASPPPPSAPVPSAQPITSLFLFCPPSLLSSILLFSSLGGQPPGSPGPVWFLAWVFASSPDMRANLYPSTTLLLHYNHPESLCVACAQMPRIGSLSGPLHSEPSPSLAARQVAVSPGRLRVPTLPHSSSCFLRTATVTPCPGLKGRKAPGTQSDRLRGGLCLPGAPQGPTRTSHVCAQTCRRHEGSR